LSTPVSGVPFERDDGLVKVGADHDVAIRQLAELVRASVGFDRELVFDTSKPVGAPRKLMDVRLLASRGWRTGTVLEEGISLAYSDFLKRHG
jgi:GDP-L-fucose synthase